MTGYPYFQIDAFTDQPFCGNMAAVCLLPQWPHSTQLQKLASELSLPETVFVVTKPDKKYEIRWFTPDIEMDLCGHATLAAAHALLNELHLEDHTVEFNSLSGTLRVFQDHGLLWLDFPSRPGKPDKLPTEWDEAFKFKPAEVMLARDYLVVFESEEQVVNWQPDRGIIDRVDMGQGGLIVTAPGDCCDFVSRFFTPRATIFEDPVTGSAHCTLIPYWQSKLQKNHFSAKQLSSRGGELQCRYKGNRVEIGGKAITLIRGELDNRVFQL